MDKDAVPELIQQTLYDAMHVGSSPSQINAWKNSLNAMYKALNTKMIPHSAGIAIEYNIPLTAKRVDFMISGYDAGSVPNVVIIELKQWSELKAVPGMDAVVETWLGGGMHRTVHPSYQAWSYATLIGDYNASVQDNYVRLHPCAYLHNYKKDPPDPLKAPQYEPYLKDAPVFLSGDIGLLRTFIADQIAEGDDSVILETIDHGKIHPSKKLQDCIVQMLEGNSEFVLIDGQQVACESILQWAEESAHDGKRRTVIVEGGPGTGKSVVAVNLLARLTAKGQAAQYVSRASAPRDVYLRKLAGRRRSTVSSLFRGSGSFIGAESGAIDTLIVDEAHRLNACSGRYANLGENQIKEIIHASKCSVFFLDERQRVTIRDIGTEAEIRKWAKDAGAELHTLRLKSQFRCNGSDGYLAWLDNVLQIRTTANFTLEGIDYDFRVVDTPHELRRLIEEKNENAGTSRITAGYCWEWQKDGKGSTDVHDIIIGDFEMSWNLDTTKTYAVDETSIHEVGCIHTVQGLEFAYIGVIIGDDMRFEHGEVITDFRRRARTDQSLRGIKKLSKENPQKAAAIADEIIKNTYRTLMTRGLKGCFVYCTDQALAQYLRNNQYGK